MTEPWLTPTSATLISTLIVTLPIFVWGITPSLLGIEFFERYTKIFLVVALTASVGAFIFGLVAKFFGQPSFVFSGFLLGGGISTGFVILAWYILKQFD